MADTESVADQTGHFVNDFVSNSYDIRKYTADNNLFREIQFIRKEIHAFKCFIVYFTPSCAAQPIG